MLFKGRAQTRGGRGILTNVRGKARVRGGMRKASGPPPTVATPVRARASVAPVTTPVPTPVRTPVARPTPASPVSTPVRILPARASTSTVTPAQSLLKVLQANEPTTSEDLDVSALVIDEHKPVARAKTRTVSQVSPSYYYHYYRKWTPHSYLTSHKFNILFYCVYLCHFNNNNK